jgi:hypothetical protein
MPKNKASDPITDQEMAFARLLLSGAMTDRRAAETVGLNPTPPPTPNPSPMSAPTCSSIALPCSNSSSNLWTLAPVSPPSPTALAPASTATGTLCPRPRFCVRTPTLG